MLGYYAKSLGCYAESPRESNKMVSRNSPVFLAMLKRARSPPPPYDPPLPSWNRGQAAAAAASTDAEGSSDETVAAGSAAETGSIAAGLSAGAAAAGLSAGAAAAGLSAGAAAAARASGSFAAVYVCFGCCEVDLSTMVFNSADLADEASAELMSDSNESEEMQQKIQREIDLAEHSDDPDMLEVMSDLDDADGLDRIYEKSRKRKPAYQKLVDSMTEKLLSEYPHWTTHLYWDGCCDFCHRLVNNSIGPSALTQRMHPVCWRKNLRLAKQANPQSAHLSFSSSASGPLQSCAVIVVTSSLRLFKFLNVCVDDHVRRLAQEVAIRVDAHDIVFIDPRSRSKNDVIDCDLTWRAWGAVESDYIELFCLTLSEWFYSFGGSSG